MNLKLLGARLLVRRLANPSQAKSGLFFPTVARERPQLGTVVKVGNKCRLPLLEGDLVMFPKFHDRFVLLEEEELVLLWEDEPTLVITNHEPAKKGRR